VIILSKTPFTLSSYYHSSEIAKYTVVSHSYEITAGIVTLYLAGYIQPLSIRSYFSTRRDLVKPGTYGWDRRPLNHCLLATQPRNYTSPLNKYLCAFSLSVRRDHLIQNAFHSLILLSLVGDRHMYCGITSLTR